MGALPLSSVSCPKCETRSPHELSVSNYAFVSYLRCDACAHVWTADKETKALRAHITQEPESKSKRA